MNKILEMRTKLEKFICRHTMSIMIFGVLVFSDFWSEKIEAIAEVLEDFLEGPIDLRSSTAEMVAEIVLIYALCAFCNWIVKFGFARAKKLFIKKPTEKTERSA